MLRLFIILLLLTSTGAYGQPISIQLPKNPAIDSIPLNWKGHNHGANVNIFEIRTADFVHAFSRLDPGIIRWPGGNSGNSYRWRDRLGENKKLNLKNLIPFLDTFGIDLQIVVNFGNGSAAEAAEFVNVCNNQSQFYRNLRDSLLNNPNPINVRYWEIGNESTDAWSFGYAWLGFQDSINFRTGVADKLLARSHADSLYYYGGEFFREGWVAIIGQLDKFTATLGDIIFYDSPKTADTITVEYPSLDISDTNAVRVYRISDFNLQWAKNDATQQEFYDRIASPENLLSHEEYSWSQTDVALAPNGGFNINDLVLIEYNSIGHDGAFAFRDSMKAADPSIEIGYNVKPGDYQAANQSFQQDFAASPPDFMIKHPYAGGLVVPAVNKGLFSDAAYVAEKKISGLVNTQKLWNQRQVDWNIPNKIGLALTEWNVALYDDAPDDHPIRGITSGLYIADYWARALEYAINDSFDLRTINHFALSSQGNNFIHLFHTNQKFSLSVQGHSATMVMEALGRGMFPVGVAGNPQLQVLTNNGQQLDTVTIDAVAAWGGIGANKEYVNLLLINRDDENSIAADIRIPAEWQADSVVLQSLFGTMINDSVFSNYEEKSLINNTYTAQLPAFSVNKISIHLTKPTGVPDSNRELIDGYVYPNPANGFVYIGSGMAPISIEIFNSTGHNVTALTTAASNRIDISGLAKGVYFIRTAYSGGGKANYKLIKR